MKFFNVFPIRFEVKILRKQTLEVNRIEIDSTSACLSLHTRASLNCDSYNQYIYLYVSILFIELANF